MDKCLEEHSLLELTQKKEKTEEAYIHFSNGIQNHKPSLAENWGPQWCQKWILSNNLERKNTISRKKSLLDNRGERGHSLTYFYEARITSVPNATDKRTVVFINLDVKILKY